VLHGTDYTHNDITQELQIFLNAIQSLYRNLGSRLSRFLGYSWSMSLHAFLKNTAWCFHKANELKRYVILQGT
jgi:hypothetical protein